MIMSVLEQKEGTMKKATSPLLVLGFLLVIVSACSPPEPWTSYPIMDGRSRNVYGKAVDSNSASIPASKAPRGEVRPCE